MKPVIFFFLVLASGSGTPSPACNKTGGNTTAAVVTGYDARQCPCCGGLMVSLQGETRPYTGPFFLVANDLSSYGITADSQFPIKVKISYRKLAKCGGNSIEVTSLSRL